VGLGTFAPVKENNIKKHKMHSEFAEISRQTALKIKKTKQEGGRVIAVGTTTVRALESWARSKPWEQGASFRGWTDIFIYPGFDFQIVDGLATNFHLPKSTLLMLVSAFAGKNFVDEAYRQAIEEKYRFYSYGDSMFVI
jgi:S-adenosylmethionine:tRNA ribosyltransferase-isomerase